MNIIIIIEMGDRNLNFQLIRNQEVSYIINFTHSQQTEKTRRRCSTLVCLCKCLSDMFCSLSQFLTQGLNPETRRTGSSV